MTNEDKMNASIFPASCFKVHLTTESKVLIPVKTISLVPMKELL